MTATEVLQLAQSCGFELAGIAPAIPSPDFARYQRWLDAGSAGKMSYLADHRAQLRADPRSLLPSARSILCVGKLYNTPHPTATTISRYAWGLADYHDILHHGLAEIAARLQALDPNPFDFKICTDTAPLLERSYARAAGLGWIGKNTCLINQAQGSWFFLGELLLSLDLEPNPTPPPDRCGSCTRCIDACPTSAIVPDGAGFKLDATLCISYFNIELKGSVPEAHRPAIGSHVFGCDICQDVCPWNRRAPATLDPAFTPLDPAPTLGDLAFSDPIAFRARFKRTPIARTGYRSFLRNVAIAMGNSGDPRFRDPLERMALSPDPVIAEHAVWALNRLPARQSE